jgi:hypothetical protein
MPGSLKPTATIELRNLKRSLANLFEIKSENRGNLSRDLDEVADRAGYLLSAILRWEVKIKPRDERPRDSLGMFAGDA